MLERTGHAADQFKVKVTPIVVTARSAGRAIVEEAIARRSEVIVLGSQGKRRIADKVFGRTIDYVLDHLPCEAIINVIPREVLAAAAAGAAGEDGEPGPATTSVRPAVDKRSVRLRMEQAEAHRPPEDSAGDKDPGAV